MTSFRNESLLEDDPLWYKDAVIYEVHVKAFSDSNGDGIGDLQGLTDKLDYLQDLGVTALWVLPFFPSPQKDDGYDTADYTSVHPAYGNVRDFQTLLREAHRRGMRIIIELVLNHTSDQHPWFQRARQSPPGSRWRNWYVWSDTPDKYQGVRTIFQDFEASNWSWDPLAKAYFWHRFYSHQPDLNYDSPDVRRQMIQIMDHWFDMGVDGLRLDAVPYLYEREGTNCENLPETHEYLKLLRAHIDGKYKNRLLLAEANQWPEDAVAYFGDGDECHMAFHFPVMPRLFMAIRMEDRFPIVEILQDTPAIPDNAQWALFLRNHDELTLEMVTDEERDYMYRVYTQDPRAQINLGIRRRLAPLLGNNRRRIELMNGLLFSLAGTVVLYYGDELGMGDNIYLGDRNGVRTPMQWSGDRNAGFSQANPQRLYLPIIIDPEYHYETVNVETQKNNPSSLLWWTKRLIALRKRYKAFSRGTMEFLQPENRKILAFVRQYEDECILVVANMDRFVQGVELDLSAFAGRVPVELFGRTKFPAVGDRPYFLTLGPHSFYWFEIEPLKIDGAPAASPAELPSLTLSGTWATAFTGRNLTAIAGLLPQYISPRRWFAGKARVIQSVQISDVIPFAVGSEEPTAHILLVRVDFTEGESDLYQLPVSLAYGDSGERLISESPQSVIARVHLRSGGQTAVLYDALWNREFCASIVTAMSRRRRITGDGGQLSVWPTKAFKQLRDAGASLDPAPVWTEQTNSSVVFGNTFIYKLFRRVEPGMNPDLEIGRYLTEEAGFTHTPPVAGAMEYRHGREQAMTLGVLQGYVPNEGDAWKYTVDAAGRYFEDVVTEPHDLDPALTEVRSLVELSEHELPPQAYEAFGEYLATAELLGQRAAEMHVALSSDEGQGFAPEAFTLLYQRSLYQSMYSLTNQTMHLLRRRMNSMEEPLKSEAQTVLGQQQAMLSVFRRFTGRKLTAMRTRTHGDFHLGQVLHTGKDLFIIDFEGEPSKSVGERRIKRSPLRDIAGMIRSFQYAAYTALMSKVETGVVREEDVATLEPCMDAWQRWVSVAFLRAYRNAAGNARFLPQDDEEFQMLLNVFTLEKAVYELSYELNNRPSWVRLPLKGIVHLLES